MSLAVVHSAEQPEKASLAGQRVSITVCKVSLTLALMNDPAVKGKEKPMELLNQDVAAEVDSLSRWFSDSTVMIAGTRKSVPGLPESETGAEILGKVSEMKMALDGYGARLPAESNPGERIQLVHELARECEQILERFSKRMRKPAK